MAKEEPKIKVTTETRRLILDIITHIYDMMDDNRLVPGLTSFESMKRNAKGLYEILHEGEYTKAEKNTLNTWRKFYIEDTTKIKNDSK